MTLFGVDIHPRYQAGINIEQIAREGFSWLTVKASQGTNTSWAKDANAWLDRGDRAGMLTFPYHYLSTDDAAAQVRAVQSYAGARPVMLDAEDGSGDVAQVRRFLDAAARAGLRVPLTYLPRWWWEKVGKASLAGLDLVSSRYRTATGYASTIYEGVPPEWWADYGGGEVAVLQFSDRATVAGQKIDVNAYRGTREEFAALIGQGAAAPARPTLRRGDTGDLVARVIRWANGDYPGYDMTPIPILDPPLFGPGTEAFVREFQRRVGFTGADIDGVLGPKTWPEADRNGFTRY